MSRQELEYLFTAYFDQDFDWWAPDDRSIIDRFAKRNDLKTVTGARDAAAALLAEDLSEPELRVRLGACGLTDYDPTGAGDMTYRQWLALIVERTTLAMERRGADS